MRGEGGGGFVWGSIVIRSERGKVGLLVAWQKGEGGVMGGESFPQSLGFAC